MKKKEKTDYIYFFLFIIVPGNPSIMDRFRPLDGSFANPPFEQDCLFHNI